MSPSGLGRGWNFQVGFLASRFLILSPIRPPSDLALSSRHWYWRWWLSLSPFSLQLLAFIFPLFYRFTVELLNCLNYNLRDYYDYWVNSHWVLGSGGFSLSPFSLQLLAFCSCSTDLLFYHSIVEPMNN